MKIFFSFFLFFIIGSTTAQTGNFTVNWVDIDDGLNQLNVRNCVVDNQGFVWIATELGLYKYDWKVATLVKNAKYPSIDKQIITQLYKDPKTGIVYFYCVPEEKIYCIENGEIRPIKDLEGRFIENQIFIAPSQPLFSAINQYLDHRNKHNFVYFKFFNNAFINKTFYYSLAKNEIHILDKNGAVKVIDFENAQNSMIFKSQGHVFVANKNKIGMITDTTINFNRFKVDKIIEAFIASEENLNNKNALLFYDDQFYINFNKSIYKIDYQNETLTAVFVFNAPNDDYFKFSYSKMQEVYVCSSPYLGMAILRKNNFNTIPTQKNIKGFNDYAVVKKNENWYNLTGWIYNKNTKKIENRSINNMTSGMRFLLEYKNDFYYGSNYQELTSLTNLKYKLPFKTDYNLINENRLTGYTYLNNELFLSKIKTVTTIINNKIIIDSLIAKQLKKNQAINALSSVNDDLIVATTNGVFLYKPFSGKIRYIKGLENGNARYIKHIDKSKFWVGCYGDGLYLVHQNKAHRVTDKNNDIATAHAIEEDNEGNLWISTNNGLLTVNKQKAISNTLKKIPIESYIFTTNDGLPTNEFNGGSTFPSLKDTDGIIGFPSMKGFVWFYPKNVKKQLFTGAIMIDELLVNKTKMLPLAKNTYKISSDAKIISLTFNYSYSGNEKNLTVSYKFDDQKTWTIINGTTIILPRYKKGSHKLQIKINTHGFEDKYDVKKFVTLDFEPRFYETSWFWILAFILGILILILSYVIGRLFNKKKERELNEKIALKTQQLQDSILELSVSKDTIKASLIEKEVLLKEIHHRVKNNLQLIMSMLNIQARRGNYADIFDFLKKGESRINTMALIHSRLYLSDQIFDKMDMQMYLEDLIISINKIHDNTDEKVHVKLNANNLNINLTTAIPLGLIINELLSNALKHGFPNNKHGDVTIRITDKGNHEFELLFEDNGIGFDAELKRARSFGLELVHLLASQLSGSVQIDTANTTKFVIKFKEILHN